MQQNSEKVAKQWDTCNSDATYDVGSNGINVSTINSKLGCLFLPSVNSSTYGLNSLYEIR